MGHGVVDKETSYFNRFVNWVNATFPHVNHVFSNQAIPGVSSAYVAPCVLRLLPKDPDMVILVSMTSEYPLSPELQAQKYREAKSSDFFVVLEESRQRFGASP